MAAVSDAERDVLESHIPAGEQLIKAYSDKQRTIAVTDRRVLNLTHQVGNRQRDTQLESTLLTTDYIVGADYNRNKSAEFPVIEWLIGASLALIGLFAMLTGMSGGGFENPQMQVVVTVVGAVLILLGVAALIIGGTGESSGGVEVTIHRAGELSDQSWAFPRGETDVAQAISEQVAELNAP